MNQLTFLKKKTNKISIYSKTKIIIIIIITNSNYSNYFPINKKFK